MGGLMSYANRTVALVAGFTLFVVGSKYAWFPTPDNYFEYFGKGVVSVTAIDTARFALPCLVLSLVFSWITLRLLARPPQVAVWWCLGGLVVGFIYWQVDGGIQWHSWCLAFNSEHADFFRRNPSVRPMECSVLTHFYSGLIWDGSIFLAILSGLATAAALTLRSERITVREAHT
jgi:hypothetical protein